MWVSSRELVLKQIWFGRKGYWIVPWLHWPRDEPRQTFPTCLTCSLNLAEAGFILIGKQSWYERECWSEILRCAGLLLLLNAIAPSSSLQKPCNRGRNKPSWRFNNHGEINTQMGTSPGTENFAVVCCKLYHATQSASPAFLRNFIKSALEWGMESG